uniref:Uncharacterized protein n=1 Tax=Arundo donax TaxID=35708 RepID=A0A0A8YPL2_ARUDO
MNSTCIRLSILYINRLDHASIDEIIKITLPNFISSSPFILLNEPFCNPFVDQTLFLDHIIFWK